MLKFVISVFSVLWLGLASAQAAVLVTGPITGQDDTATVLPLLDMGNVRLGKIETDPYVPGIGEDDAVAGIGNLVSIVFDSMDQTSGTVTFDLSATGFEMQYFTLKAGNGFSVFELAAPMSVGSFTFSTLLGGLTNMQGVPHGLSHISFFGTAADPVPLPGAAWLFAVALSLMGAARRRATRA